MKRRSYTIRPDDRILFIRLSAIGDVVNAIPGIVALRKSYPNNFLAWCVEDTSEDLLRNHPAIDELLLYRRQWRGNLLSSATCTGWSRLIARIRELHFDVVIDGQDLMKSGLIAWLSGAPIRVGPDFARNIDGYKAFLNVLTEANGPYHAAAVPQRAYSLKGLGIDISNLEYVLPPLAGQTAKVRGMLGMAGIDLGAFSVVLNPCASKQEKQWPGEYFSELGRTLVRDFGARIIWTGSRSERPYIKQLAEAMAEPSCNLAGELTLSELAALFRQVRVMVTGDTGPMHIGAAAGVFVIALFGPTDPGLNGPHTERKVVLSARITCQYCRNKKCPSPSCLRALGPQQVVGQIRRLREENAI